MHLEAVIASEVGFHYDGAMSLKHPRIVHRHARPWLGWSIWLGGSTARWMAVAVFLIALSGCSLSTRPLEPPVVRISGLELLGNDRARLDLMITNLNPEPLMPSGVMLQLAIEGKDWVISEQPIQWQVSPSARETVSITVSHEDREVLAWLQEVSENQRPSVRWSMTLSLSVADDQTIETENTGFLYRVPGQAMRFR